MADESNSVDSPDNGATTRARKIAVAVALVLLLIAVAVVVKVSSDGDSTPATTTVPPSTESTLPAASQKVVADYRAFWDAYLQASNPMRPDSPELAAHATGEQYAKLVNTFSGALASNAVFKGTIDNRPKVVSVTDNKAELRDCLGDQTGSYDATTGERKDAPSDKRDLVVVSLELVDGTWKVSRLDGQGEGCDAP